MYAIDPLSGATGDAILLSMPNDTDRFHGLTVSPNGLQAIVIYYEDDYYTADGQLWLYDLGVMDGELYLAGKTRLNVVPPSLPGEQFDPYELEWSHDP